MKSRGHDEIPKPSAEARAWPSWLPHVLWLLCVFVSIARVVGAQAIEGIASYPKKELALSSLNSLSQHVSESFLRDRIARSGEYLRNSKVDSTDKQDENALKKLVE